jgi:hypothetical protein
VEQLFVALLLQLSECCSVLLLFRVMLQHFYELLNQRVRRIPGENPFSLPSKVESVDPRILTCAIPWVTELLVNANVQ